MFLHKQELQVTSTPDKPDFGYARKLQEVLGGQYGEITIVRFAVARRARDSSSVRSRCRRRSRPVGPRSRP